MANLKELRRRITSVTATRKITSAMRMVAAARLRRAQEQALASRPYALHLKSLLENVAAIPGNKSGGKLYKGTGSTKRHLFLVVTTDKGLCGGLNTNITRKAKRAMQTSLKEGSEVSFLCVGKKGEALLKRDCQILHTFSGTSKSAAPLALAKEVASWLTTQLEEGTFDVCKLFAPHFVSVLEQEVQEHQLIPFSAPPSESSPESNQESSDSPASSASATSPSSPPECEPDPESVLQDLLQQTLVNQMYRALLEVVASEHGARMTAMENASRNAGDMLDRLTLLYNRTRQAAITGELIEIVSAKEAM